MPQQLLKEIETIRSLYERLNRQHGEQFNVFTITGISERETLMCRMLYDLLNPLGSHGQGAIYLKWFVEKIVKLPFTDEDYKHASVAYEYMISDKRRIDIVILTPNYRIPIEVKIYAGDQKNQCHDYYQWAVNSNVYYVTIEGRMPSANSLGTLSKDVITCVSFEKDIISWLEKCMTTLQTVHLTSIREILRQMIEAIRQFCGEVGDEEMNETLQLIMRDKQTMKNAKIIQEAFEKSHGEMIRKVFDRLKEEIPFDYIAREGDYESDNFASIRNYRSKPYPVMYFKMYDNWQEGMDLYLYIEVNWRLYVGFTMFDAKDEYYYEGAKLQQYFPDLKVEETVVWDYLPNNVESPLFHKPPLQNNYFDLFDEQYFEQFIQNCMQRIQQLIQNIKPA